MSNQNAPPPAQQQARQQDQQKAEASEQAKEQSSQASVARQATKVAVAFQTQEKQESALKAEEAVAVAGRAGERHINIEWMPVTIDGHVPVYFIVTTAPGNALEVRVEQLVYRKDYAGTGRVQTNVIPIAPIGTKGRIVVRDTASGETLEQPWTWYRTGGGSLFGWLFGLLKRLFTNPAG